MSSASLKTDTEARKRLTPSVILTLASARGVLRRSRASFNTHATRGVRDSRGGVQRVATLRQLFLQSVRQGLSVPLNVLDSERVKIIEGVVQERQARKGDGSDGEQALRVIATRVVCDLGAWRIQRIGERFETDGFMRVEQGIGLGGRDPRARPRTSPHLASARSRACCRELRAQAARAFHRRPDCLMHRGSFARLASAAATDPAW